MYFIWPVGLVQEGKALKLIKGGVVWLKVWNALQIAVDYFRILRFVRVQLTVYISLRETRNMALNEVAVCTRKVMGKCCWSLLGEVLGPKSSGNSIQNIFKTVTFFFPFKLESEKCGRKGSAQSKMVFLQFPMVQ